MEGEGAAAEQGCEPSAASSCPGPLALTTRGATKRKNPEQASPSQPDRAAHKRLRRGPSGGAPHIVVSVAERELSAEGHRKFRRTQAAVKFRNMRPQAEVDTFDPRGSMSRYRAKRSKIVEIVSAQDYIFALTHTGVCACFHRRTTQRICFLNTSPDEVIRSLFYNKENGCLILVSVYRVDNFSSLNCRSCPLEDCRNGEVENGACIFQGESLKWPGFVEFDDVNSKVLTYSAQNSVYKIWGLKEYNLLYSINSAEISEIKISPGIMLLVMEHGSSDSQVRLKILDIETGAVSFQQPLVAERWTGEARI